jgi:hypothetical protein
MDPTLPKPVLAPRYRRLPGLRFSGGFARAALRMADDHLLLCDFRMSFVERYKRFYFGDIEGFIVRKTLVWFVAIGVWLGIAGLIYLIASSAKWNFYVTLGLEGVCALFVLRNLIRGPSCRTHIQTAVQTDALPMLNRVRKTRHVFRQLFPLIREAQADISGVNAASSPAAQTQTTTGVPSEAASPAQPVTVEATPRPRAPLSKAHLLTFLLLLFAGVAALLNVTTRSPWSFIVALVFFFAVGLSGIGALIFQVRHPVPRAAAAANWILVVLCLVGGVGVNAGYCWLDMFLQAERNPRVPPHFRQLSPLTMRTMPGFDYVLWIFGVTGVMLGLVGLISVFRPAFAKAQPPPLPESAVA